MILPDVNVLIYAFRKDVAQHAVCRTWLDKVIRGNAPFGVSSNVLNAVIRVTTNPRTYVVPSSLDEAIGFSEDLRQQPHCRLVEPGDRHWPIFTRLLSETDTRGPRVTDAWLAALAIEWDCEWVTLDRDFARFAGLKWRVPEAG